MDGIPAAPKFLGVLLLDCSRTAPPVRADAPSVLTTGGAVGRLSCVRVRVGVAVVMLLIDMHVEVRMVLE